MTNVNLLSSCPDMPGLVPGIRASSGARRDWGAPVDGRVKPGHDEKEIRLPFVFSCRTGR